MKLIVAFTHKLLIEMLLTKKKYTCNLSDSRRIKTIYIIYHLFSPRKYVLVCI